jgi:hypothetical protein
MDLRGAGQALITKAELVLLTAERDDLARAAARWRTRWACRYLELLDEREAHIIAVGAMSRPE